MPVTRAMSKNQKEGSEKANSVSQMSKASSTRRSAEVEIEAIQELANLELEDVRVEAERNKIEIKKRMVEQRLQLQIDAISEGGSVKSVIASQKSVAVIPVSSPIKNPVSDWLKKCQYLPDTEGQILL